MAWKSLCHQSKRPHKALGLHWVMQWWFTTTFYKQLANWHSLVLSRRAPVIAERSCEPAGNWAPVGGLSKVSGTSFSALNYSIVVMLFLKVNHLNSIPFVLLGKVSLNSHLNQMDFVQNYSKQVALIVATSWHTHDITADLTIDVPSVLCQFWFY